jgi:hypothetical protein
LNNAQSDSKLLSGFSRTINGNPDNNLESTCILEAVDKSRFRNVNFVILRHIFVDNCILYRVLKFDAQIFMGVVYLWNFLLS